jgi:UDP-glucose 4-epimerase
MKVLVTGGAGFIGSHLVSELIKNNEVVVLDNLTSGDREWVHKDARFIKGDVRDRNDVENAMKGCSAVFHLAALTDIRTTEPDMDYKVNCLGAKRVFDVATNKNVKIIFTSSAAVYGNIKLPHKEDSECKPISQYGKSKLRAEKLCPENSFILRLFNVYGERGNSVINKFCKLALESLPFTIYGSGLNTRDYIYVKDVVKALILGLKNSGVYNLGTGVETTTLDVAHIVAKSLGIEPEFEFLPPNEQEIKRSRADISKIKDLGWKPQTDLVKGINLMLEKSYPA